MMTQLQSIRNFAIIAHIDHGKSSLADWFIRYCGGLTDRDMRSQVLDSMELERERGITIKAQTVRLSYSALNGHTYQLNLIDTPGHVDFGYEVSRSLAACEGSVLVIDSSQGVEAQTLANVYKALENNHEIVCVLNKMDLPAAEPDRVRHQVEELIGLRGHDALLVSAKTGENVKSVLEAVIRELPPPSGDQEKPLKALLIDSWYDSYLGVVILTRIFEGQLRIGMKFRLMSSGVTYTVDRVGIFTPKAVSLELLNTGEVGFIIAGIRNIEETKIGDTLTEDSRPTAKPLEGFHPSIPVVFCSFFPEDATNFEKLRTGLGKLRLNDASFWYEPETSTALGLGFRCGFLGMLHLEIIKERLKREFHLDLIMTAPSVVYKVCLKNGKLLEAHNPSDMPDSGLIDYLEEPWIKATIVSSSDTLGDILSLCTERRGEQVELSYVNQRVLMVYCLPLNEVIFDFYDRLKSLSHGYASFDYTLDGYRPGELVKVKILVNGEDVDALSCIIHRSKAEAQARSLCLKLKTLIPRQLFKIAIQAAIGSRIIARETISALRKDVLAKCYGGDITRKRKLLEKQKSGKKRMRQFGHIEIPQNIFIEALKK